MTLLSTDQTEKRVHFDESLLNEDSTIEKGNTTD